MSGYELSRRRVLQLSGATMAALAGCSGSSTVGEDDISDDPNPYDYQFVEADDLARSLPQFDDKDVTTKTRVAVNRDRYLWTEEQDQLRMYEAHPEDSDYTFTVFEELNGPIHNELGDMLDDDSHTDVMLQLYGFVDRVEEDGRDEERYDFDEYAFVAEDAETVE